jgi:integrase
MSPFGNVVHVVSTAEETLVAKRSFGSVRKLPSGRYQARFNHPETKQVVLAPATFAAKADATAWLAGAQTDIVRGHRAEVYVPTVTFETYAKGWLSNRVLRPRTVELYQGLLDRHINPTLGRYPIGRLAPGNVREWHGQLSKADKPGPVTVAKSYRLVHAICETAYVDELISRNPCNLKGASVERSAERPVLSVGQLDRVVASMEERYRGMVILAAWCSMRLGELLALTRGDIDLEAGSVRVDKSAAEMANGDRYVGPPKTAAGMRVMFIPPHVLGAVSSHLNEFTGPNAEDLVFVGIKGQPVRRASLYTAWRRALEGANLGPGLEGFRFHDLRHTGATLAAGAGASTRELMARLGHSSTAAAMRYQHATSDRDALIARALSDLASGPKD